MNDPHVIRGTAAGFDCPVLIPEGVAQPLSRSGIAGCGVVDVDGEPRFAVTIVHQDGFMLTALLDETLINEVAGQMADFLEALPPIASQARH